MSQTEQKARERFYLDRFLVLVDFEEPKQILEGEPIPDFLLQYENKTIGVEVTEIFRRTQQGQTPRQAVENRRGRVAKIAREIWESRDFPFVEVSISFASLDQFSLKTIQEMAKQLVCFVQDHLPEPNNFRIVDLDGSNYWIDYPLVSDMVDRISIIRSDVHTKSYWSVSDGDFVPNLTMEHLQEVIDKKNTIDYDLANGLIWLLVVADSSRLSSFFDIPKEVSEHHFVSRFDQTFLFDTVGKKPILLRTKRPI